ncbi:LuxR C-terminal-related transcriptional regulator [Streptomyces sp. NPDC005648]|uniref:helix-turn-helix transcriptional regulator n=1 Tax=Streptomyces sp. NPDC005648 TaxID=3157044 RepID=UPI0033B401C3
MGGGRAGLSGAQREAVALLAAGATRARGGTGGLVLLRGATGTGRTTVLETAAEDAAAHGMRVLRARCAPGELAVPFAVARQLFGYIPELEEPGAERERVDLLWRALCSYTDESPLLVAVDDVHLADGPSYRWLVEFARHVDRSPRPVLLAVTERSQYDIDPPAPGFAHTLSRALVQTYTLPPLSPETASALVLDHFPAAPRSWIDHCTRATAANPLLLRALLEDLGEPGRSEHALLPAAHTTLRDVHTALPDTCAALYPGAFPAAVSWWLDSAGPGTAEVARVLAVLDEGWDGPTGHGFGCPVDGLAALLAELAGADVTRVAGWLTAMTGLGLLRPDADSRPRYAHPLLRDAVLTGVPAARRRAAHRQVAEAMVKRGAPTETVARQLLLSDPAGTHWASGVLQDAAALAVRDDRLADAVAFLRRALDEPMTGPRRLRLLTELGSLEYTVEESPAGALRLAEALRQPGEAHDRVRAAVALGTALAGLGKARVAVDVLRQVDGDGLFTDRPDLVRTLRTASALLSDQDQEVRQEVYRGLSDTAERSPDLAGTAGQALLVRHAAAAGLISAEDAMKRVRGLLAEPADPLTEPFLLGTAAAVAQWADELDEAERLVERGLAGQRRDLLHPMHHALLMTRADIAAARADHASLLTDPRTHALLAPSAPDTRTASSAPSAPGPTNLHAQTLLALVETGRLAEATRLADAVDLQRVPDSWELNRFLYARGVFRAAVGDPAGALHDFLECGRRQSARDVVSPVVTPWRTAAAECRIALGHPREALVLAEEELRLARVWDTPRTTGRALRVLAVATGGRRGAELAEEAVRLLRSAPAGTELAAALIAQGRLLTAAGDRSRARACLREAASHAERLGAARLLTLAEQGLREGGARRTAAARTGSGSLTDSERRIAGLAADGRTNTEIAALLHLARRTVETHLTSTYKKLGIRRRAELREAMNGD